MTVEYIVTEIFLLLGTVYWGALEKQIFKRHKARKLEDKQGKSSLLVDR